jgi:sugar phosphate isomerase/epimerase
MENKKMKLGADSVLFGGFPLETAFKYLALAGYDGIELSAIDGMSEHLILDRWQELIPDIKRYAKTYNLQLMAIKNPSQDSTRMELAFQAAVELGIPLITTDPIGKADDEAAWLQEIDSLGKLALRAEHHGITLCVKAHVGKTIYNTPTTLRAMKEISSSAFGIDMDPSHIYRAGENPVDAIAAVISRVKHVHIRDCKGRQQGPGSPAMQANGRGDIDLVGYIRVLHQQGYNGPLDLENIGTKGQNTPLEECCIIAAESRGHMQACLQACGAR